MATDDILRMNICPKCGVDSGDNWSRCHLLCPMPDSPYYHPDCLELMEQFTEDELSVLDVYSGYDDEYHFSFRRIESRVAFRLPVPQIVRALAQKGVLEFRRGLRDDEGYFAGSGYGLTNLGYRILESLNEKWKRERDYSKRLVEKEEIPF